MDNTWGDTGESANCFNDSSSNIGDLHQRISYIEQAISSNYPVPATDFVSPIKYNAVLERLNQLETLLTASEVDNKNLNQEFNQFKTNQSQLKYYHSEQLKSKDCHIRDLEQKKELFQSELTNYKIRFENVTAYINSLPSEEELNEANENIKRLEKENFLLKEKETRMKCVISELQKEIINKEKLYQTALTKLEDLKPLEVAKNDLQETIFGQESSFNDENAKQIIIAERARLLRCRKMIESLREKLNHSDMEKTIALSKVSDLVLNTAELEQQIEYETLELTKLMERLKTEEEKRISIEETCSKLQHKIEQMEDFNQLQRQHFGKFVQLVADVDLCVAEMKNLVDLGLKLEQGEEIPVDDLVGLSVQDEDSDDETTWSAESETVTGGGQRKISYDNDTKNCSTADLEWVLKTLTQVSEFRKDISSLKVRMMDFYADIISGKFEGCNVQ